MRKGQRVRLRASAQAARDWGVSVGAEGAVLCEYNVGSGASGSRACIDVRISPETVIWGAPSLAFELVGEPAQPFGA